MRSSIEKHLLTFYQLLLAVIYFSAGLNKLFNFPHIIGPPWLITELAKYELELFGYFIAIMQVITGGLLFIMRFRFIASLMLLPMQVCVFIIPISLGWQGTPYINAVFLYMLFHLLYSERKALINLFTIRPLAGKNTGHNKTYWITFCSLWAFVLLPWLLYT